MTVFNTTLYVSSYNKLAKVIFQ